MEVYNEIQTRLDNVTERFQEAQKALVTSINQRDQLNQQIDEGRLRVSNLAGSLTTLESLLTTELSEPESELEVVPPEE